MTIRREGREGREREGERDRERGSRAKPGIQLVIYIYIIQILCVCLSVKYRRPNCWTDHDHIWHAYADRPGNGSYQQLAP